MGQKLNKNDFEKLIRNFLIKEMKSVKTEGYGRYFDEHDSVENYNLTLISSNVIDKGDYSEHILVLKGLPKIGHLNTRNSTWEEMLDFIAKYSEHKDDAVSNYINNIPYLDDLTIKEDGQEYTFSMSDIGDFARAERNKLSEMFDDEDELGMFSGDFDADEFEGEAMKAAMADIGSEFVPLGKSKFEKNLDPEEFKADLKRQNLKLPKDKEELEKIQRTLDVKKKHEKQFGAGSMNEEYNFDMSNLYRFLKDALYFCESEGLDYAQTAKVVEEALKQNFEITKKMDEGYVNPDTKIDRPKDAEGQPLTLNTRVEDLETGAVGRIERFGVNDKGELNVHVNWMGSNFGQPVPSYKVSPKSIVARDRNRIVREEEIEESTIRSHANGRGQNIKPGNYPRNLKRAGLREGLESAEIEEKEDEVFLVIDNAFNRTHYPDLIGKTYPDAPPAYAQGKVVKSSEVEVESKKRYDESVEEDYSADDFRRAEIEFHNQEAQEELTSKIKELVPEELQKFIEPHSITTNAGIKKAYATYYSFELSIPKQADETLVDIEKYIREELNMYQNVELYTELEKITNNWIIKVKIYI